MDPFLHLFGWIILGAGFASYSKQSWLDVFPVLVHVGHVLSNEVYDLLPESSLLVALISFAVCSTAAFFLSGSENKGAGMRGAWLFFAGSRVMFPVSACEFGGKGEGMEVRNALYFLFVGLSFVGPLASWPARTFALSDLVYAVVAVLSGQGCVGTEAAVVATCLVLAHDVVHMRFLHFLEWTAIAMASIFIIETFIVVVSLHDEKRVLATTGDSWTTALNPWSSPNLFQYFVMRAPPVLLTSWSVGMYFRTYTQGRISLKEALFCLVLSGSVGAVVLYASADYMTVARRPLFACLVAITAMATSTQLSSGRKRLLKRNKYFVASGFFKLHSASSEELFNFSNEGADDEILLDEMNQIVEREMSENEQKHTEGESDDIGLQQLRKQQVNGADDKKGISQRKRSAVGEAASAVVTKVQEFAQAAGVEVPISNENKPVQELQEEYQDLLLQVRAHDKKLFYFEALAKGSHNEEAKKIAALEVERYREQIKRSQTEIEEMEQLLKRKMAGAQDDAVVA